MAGLGTGAPIVKVYHEKSMILPDVSRVLACLYEKDIDFQRHTASYKSLLRLQASSHAPVPFYDGLTFLEESREICRYIAETYEHRGYPFLLGKDSLERASIEQWLHHEEHTFNPPSRSLFCHLAFPPAQEDDDIDLQKRKLEEVLEVYEQRLGDSEFLAGNKFTLADLVHLPNSQYITDSDKFVYLYDSRKNVQRWWNAISTRDSWQKVLKDIQAVEQQRKQEELEKQQQRQWLRKRPKTTRPQIRLDPRKHDITKSQTILVPPPVGIISTLPTAPQAEKPLPTETSLDEPLLSTPIAPKSSAVQSKHTTTSITQRESPPAPVQSAPRLPGYSHIPVQSTSQSFTPATSPTTAENPSRSGADKSKIRGVSLSSEATEIDPSSHTDAAEPYIEPTPHKPSEMSSNATDHVKTSPRSAKEDSDTSGFWTDNTATNADTQDKKSVLYTDHTTQRPAETIDGRSTDQRVTYTSLGQHGSTEAHQELQAEKWHATAAGLSKLKGETDSEQYNSSQDSEQESTHLLQEPVSMGRQLVQGPEMTTRKPYIDQKRDVSSIPWQQAADVQEIAEDNASLDHRDAVLPPYARKHGDEAKVVSADHGKDASLPKRVKDEATQATPFQTAYDDAHDISLEARETASPVKKRYSGGEDTTKQSKDAASRPRRMADQEVQDKFREPKVADSLSTREPPSSTWRAPPRLPRHQVDDDHSTTVPSQKRDPGTGGTIKEVEDNTYMPGRMAGEAAKESLEETKFAESASSRAQRLYPHRTDVPSRKQEAFDDPLGATSPLERRYADFEDTTKHSRDTAFKPSKMVGQNAEDTSEEEEEEARNAALRAQPPGGVATTPSKQEAEDALNVSRSSRKRYPEDEETSKQTRASVSMPTNVAAQDARDVFRESKVADSTTFMQQPSDARASVPFQKQEVPDASSKKKYPDAKGVTKKSKVTFEETKSPDSASSRVQPSDSQRDYSPSLQKEATEPPRATSQFRKRHSDDEDTAEHSVANAFKPRKMVDQDTQGTYEETKASDHGLHREQSSDTWQAATTPTEKGATEDGPSVIPPSERNVPSDEDTTTQPRGTASAPRRASAGDASGAFQDSKPADSVSSREQPLSARQPVVTPSRQETEDSLSKISAFHKTRPFADDSTRPAVDTDFGPRQIGAEDAKDITEETKVAESAPSVRARPTYTPRTARPPSEQAEVEEDARDKDREGRDTFSAPKKMVSRDAEDTYGQREIRHSASIEGSLDNLQASSPIKQAAAEDPHGATRGDKEWLIDEPKKSQAFKDASKKSVGTFEETKGPGSTLPTTQTLSAQDAQHTNRSSRTPTADQWNDGPTQLQSNLQDAYKETKSLSAHQKGLGSSPSQAEAGDDDQPIMDEKTISSEQLRKMLKESQSALSKSQPADSRSPIKVERTPSVYQEDHLLAPDNREQPRTLPTGERADGSAPERQQAPVASPTSEERLTSPTPPRAKVHDDHTTAEPFKRETVDDPKGAPHLLVQEPTSQVRRATELTPDGDTSSKPSTIDQWQRTSAPIQGITPNSGEKQGSYAGPSTKLYEGPSHDFHGTADDKDITKYPSRKAPVFEYRPDSTAADTYVRPISGNEPGISPHQGAESPKAAQTMNSEDQRNEVYPSEKKFAPSDKDSVHSVQQSSPAETRKQETIVAAAEQTLPTVIQQRKQVMREAPISDFVPTKDINEEKNVADSASTVRARPTYTPRTARPLSDQAEVEEDARDKDRESRETYSAPKKMVSRDAEDTYGEREIPHSASTEQFLDNLQAGSQLKQPSADDSHAATRGAKESLFDETKHSQGVKGASKKPVGTFEETKGPGSTLPKAAPVSAQDAPDRSSRTPTADHWKDAPTQIQSNLQDTYEEAKSSSAHQKGLGLQPSQAEAEDDDQAIMGEKVFSSEELRKLVKESGSASSKAQPADSRSPINAVRTPSVYQEDQLVAPDSRERPRILPTGERADGPTPKRKQAPVSPSTSEEKSTPPTLPRAKVHDDHTTAEPFNRDIADDPKGAPRLLGREPTSHVQHATELTPDGDMSSKPSSIHQWQRTSASIEGITPNSGDDVLGVSTIDQMPTPMIQQSVPSAQGGNEMVKGEQRMPSAPAGAQTPDVQHAAPSFAGADMTERDGEPVEMQEPTVQARPTSVPTRRAAPDARDNEFVNTSDAERWKALKAKHDSDMIDEDVRDASLSTSDSTGDKKTTWHASEAQVSDTSPGSTTTPVNVRPTSGDEFVERFSRDQEAKPPESTQAQTPSDPPRDSVSTRDVPSDALDKTKFVKPSSTEGMRPTTGPASTFGAQLAEHKLVPSDKISAGAAQPLSSVESRKEDTSVSAADQTKKPQNIFRQEARPSTPITKQIPSSNAYHDTRKIQQVTFDNLPTDDSPTPHVPSYEKVSPETIPSERDMTPVPGTSDSPASNTQIASAEVQRAIPDNYRPDELTVPFVSSEKQGSYAGSSTEPYEGPSHDAHGAADDKDITKYPSRKTPVLEYRPDSAAADSNVRPTSGDEPGISPHQGAESPKAAQATNYEDQRNEVYPSENKFAPSDKDPVHSVQQPSPAETRKWETVVAAAEQALPTISQQRTQDMREAPTSDFVPAKDILSDPQNVRPDKLALAGQKFASSDQDTPLTSPVAPRNEEIRNSTRAAEPLFSAVDDQTKDPETTIGQQDIAPTPETSKSPSSDIHRASGKFQEVAPNDQHTVEPLASQGQVSRTKPSFVPSEGPTHDSHSDIDKKSTKLPYSQAQNSDPKPDPTQNRSDGPPTRFVPSQLPKQHEETQALQPFVGPYDSKPSQDVTSDTLGKVKSLKPSSINQEASSSALTPDPHLGSAPGQVAPAGQKLLFKDQDSAHPTLKSSSGEPPKEQSTVASPNEAKTSPEAPYDSIYAKGASASTVASPNEAKTSSEAPYDSIYGKSASADAFGEVGPPKATGEVIPADQSIVPSVQDSTQSPQLSPSVVSMTDVANADQTNVPEAGLREPGSSDATRPSEDIQKFSPSQKSLEGTSPEEKSNQQQQTGQSNTRSKDDIIEASGTTKPDISTSGDIQPSARKERMQGAEGSRNQQQVDQDVLESTLDDEKQFVETEARDVGTVGLDETNQKNKGASQMDASEQPEERLPAVQPWSNDRSTGSKPTKDAPRSFQGENKSDSSSRTSEEPKLQVQTEGKTQGGESMAPAPEIEQPDKRDLPLINKGIIRPDSAPIAGTSSDMKAASSLRDSQSQPPAGTMNVPAVSLEKIESSRRPSTDEELVKPMTTSTPASDVPQDQDPTRSPQLSPSVVSRKDVTVPSEKTQEFSPDAYFAKSEKPHLPMEGSNPVLTSNEDSIDLSSNEKSTMIKGEQANTILNASLSASQPVGQAENSAVKRPLSGDVVSSFSQKNLERTLPEEKSKQQEQTDQSSPKLSKDDSIEASGTASPKILTTSEDIQPSTLKENMLAAQGSNNQQQAGQAVFKSSQNNKRQIEETEAHDNGSDEPSEIRPDSARISGDARRTSDGGPATSSLRDSPAQPPAGTLNVPAVFLEKMESPRPPSADQEPMTPMISPAPAPDAPQDQDSTQSRRLSPSVISRKDVGNANQTNVTEAGSREPVSSDDTRPSEEIQKFSPDASLTKSAKPLLPMTGTNTVKSPLEASIDLSGVGEPTTVKGDQANTISNVVFSASQTVGQSENSVVKGPLSEDFASSFPQKSPEGILPGEKSNQQQQTDQSNTRSSEDDSIEARGTTKPDISTSGDTQPSTRKERMQGAEGSKNQQQADQDVLESTLDEFVETEAQDVGTIGLDKTNLQQSTNQKNNGASQRDAALEQPEERLPAVQPRSNDTSTGSKPTKGSPGSVQAENKSESSSRTSEEPEQQVQTEGKTQGGESMAPAPEVEQPDKRDLPSSIKKGITSQSQADKKSDSSLRTSEEPEQQVQTEGKTQGGESMAPAPEVEQPDKRDLPSSIKKGITSQSQADKKSDSSLRTSEEPEQQVQTEDKTQGGEIMAPAPEVEQPDKRDLPSSIKKGITSQSQADKKSDSSLRTSEEPEQQVLTEGKTQGGETNAPASETEQPEERDRPSSSKGITSQSRAETSGKLDEQASSGNKRRDTQYPAKLEGSTDDTKPAGTDDNPSSS